MAPSPKDRKIDLISFDILVDGSAIPGTYTVKEIMVSRELNKIPYAKITLVDGNPSKEEFEISESGPFKHGAAIKINAGYHQENDVIFEGIVITQKTRLKGEETSEIIVTAKDKAVKMTVARKNKYFVQKKDSDIMSEVIGESGLESDVEATAQTHKEVIQYYSTDWDFMMTRAEFNGRVVNVNAGKIEIKKPDVGSGPVLTLKQGTSILKSDFDSNAERQIKEVKAYAWDFSTQKLNEAVASEPTAVGQGDDDGAALADSVGGGTVELHSTVPLDPDYLKTWADARLLKARLAKITGSISFYGSSLVIPGNTIEIQGMGSKYNGNAYVSGVHHRISEGTWITECEVGLSEKWFSETKPNISGGAGGGLLPGIEGLQIGTVQKIDGDPDGEFRVLVDMPMIAASGDGVWARLTQNYATNTAGSVWFPELGDEVILGFLNHDPRYPVILGSVYSKAKENPYPADAPNTYKAIVTNSHMKIEFEDVKRIIKILTPNGNIMTFSDDEGLIQIDDENKNQILMDSAGISVYTPKDMVFKADQNIKMEAGQAISIKAGTDMKLDALNITAKASVAFSAQGTTAELKGSAQAVVKGGMVMIN